MPDITEAEAPQSETAIARSVRAILPDLADFYQDLHAHPEIAFQETRTTSRLADALTRLGYRVTTSGTVTGLVASLSNGPGPVVGVRADIDALPIREETGLPYASEGRECEPAMHACGHDVHTTALLGAARLLREDLSNWSGTLVLVAQPAEETGSGARALADSGLLDEHPRPHLLLGQHVGGEESGVVRSRPDVYQAGQVNWRIVLRSPGGHAATPHRSISLLPVAAQLILRIQSIASLEVDARETTIVVPTTVHAGTATNVLPDELVLTVCARSLSSDVLQLLDAAIRRVARVLTESEGLPTQPAIEQFNVFPANVNDPEAFATVRDALLAEFGDGTFRKAEPMLGSEDFGDLASYLGVPSMYWHFGITPSPLAARPDRALAGHSPYFAPDPRQALTFGTRALVTATRAGLKASAS